MTAPLIQLTAAQILAGDVDHPEAVASDSGGVLWCGGEDGQLYRIDPGSTSARCVASTGGFILGVTVDGDDGVLLCDVGKQAVWRWHDDHLEVLTRGCADAPLHHPNASVIDVQGRLFITDSGHWDQADGRIIIIDADGARVASTAHADFPNGAALHPGGRYLYVAESLRGITRSLILPDGSLGDREDVWVMPDDHVADGIAFTADGRLIVCCYAPNRLYLLDAGGTPGLLLDDARALTLGMPANCCLLPGGDLIIANLGLRHLTRCRTTLAPPARRPARLSMLDAGHD